MRSKNIVAVAMMVAVALFCGVAFADNPPPQPPPDHYKQTLDLIRDTGVGFRDMANSFASETKAAVVAVFDGVKVVTPDLIDKVGKLSVHAWEILIRQQYIKGITELFESTFAFSLLGIYVFFIKKIIPGNDPLSYEAWSKLNKNDYRSDYNDYKILFTVLRIVIPMIVSVIGMIVFSCHIGDAVGYLLNPEYFAAKDVLGIIYSLKH